jgi:hypothetical protein
VNRERLYFGASLGAIAGYVLAVLTSYPIRLFYDPHTASWSAIDVPGQPIIRWYGSVINAALGALIGAAVMWPIRRPVRWPVIWVLALLALALLTARERAWFQH